MRKKRDKKGRLGSHLVKKAIYPFVKSGVRHVPLAATNCPTVTDVTTSGSQKDQRCGVNNDTTEWGHW